MAADSSGLGMEEVHQRLPVLQIPREKEARKQIFRRLDTNRNGCISLSELQSGIPALFECADSRRYVVPLQDLKPAIKCAFNAARKISPLKKKRAGKRRFRRGGGETVDAQEFHALLVALRTYLELDVLFHVMDSDENRLLSWHEVKQPRCLSLLGEWSISPEMAERKFPDEWTEALKFEDFAEWCVGRKFGSMPLELDACNPEATVKDAAGDGAVGKMLEAFEAWDQDGNGWIDQAELTDVLLKLDPTFTEAMAQKLFTAADVNEDGRVDYIEFINWITA